MLRELYPGISSILLERSWILKGTPRTCGVYLLTSFIRSGPPPVNTSNGISVVSE